MKQRKSIKKKAQSIYLFLIMLFPFFVFLFLSHYKYLYLNSPVIDFIVYFIGNTDEMGGVFLRIKYYRLKYIDFQRTDSCLSEIVSHRENTKRGEYFPYLLICFQKFTILILYISLYCIEKRWSSVYNILC